MLRKLFANVGIKLKEVHIFSSQLPPILVKCEKWDALDVDLKVRQSQKQIMVTSILPKNE